jgi:hypothetical protein
MHQRKMRIGMSIRYHPAAWRHPDVAADCTLHVEHYVRSAQTSERGKPDMVLFNQNVTGGGNTEVHAQT